MSDISIQNKDVTAVAEFSKIILCLRKISIGDALLLSATVGGFVAF